MIFESETMLTGYTPEPAYSPGDTIPLHLSGIGSAHVQLVRLQHGDTNPSGPGLKFQPVAQMTAQHVMLHPQPIRPGSFFRIEKAGPAQGLSCWIFPTRWPSDYATLFQAGNIRLSTTSTGRVVWWDATSKEHVDTPLKLMLHSWHGLVVTHDPSHKKISIFLTSYESAHVDKWETVATEEKLVSPESPLYFSAAEITGQTQFFFDGKIGVLKLWSKSLSLTTIRKILSDKLLKIQPQAFWHFGYNFGDWTVTDVQGGSSGILHNAPTRAVTGHRWDGSEHRASRSANLYDAVHFHHDDLEDACWPVTTTLILPDNLSDGVYAAWIHNQAEQSWITFIVRNVSTTNPKQLVVLLPTMTYLAYANEKAFPPHETRVEDPHDSYISNMGLLSLYNFHADGSGVAMASWRRPMSNMRPNYRYWLTGHPHGISADLYLLNWLDSQNIAYDLRTDHDLHSFSDPLHEEHLVLITGAHPEYWTSPSMQQLTNFLGRGGRLAYLGGNGFAARVGIHSDKPHLMELRRRLNGEGLWDAAPGEMELATTGEIGGYWRHMFPCGRITCGVDISGMGFTKARPYKRLPAADDPRSAFIFKGVTDAYFGDYGLHMGGAAGYEIDSTDFTSGTPPHALVVARAEDFDDYVSMDQYGVKRADMVFFETLSGGAVFSVGSITWSGSLSHNTNRNPVSIITSNVLERFLNPEPFPFPPLP